MTVRDASFPSAWSPAVVIIFVAAVPCAETVTAPWWKLFAVEVSISSRMTLPKLTSET